MAYVGNPIDTQNTFQSLQGKRFSGDGSTTDFTLDVAPGNVLDIEVFVGNVRQDPNSAYTVSGTTLSFTGAPPSGTNNIYVVHQAKSVGTIDVPALGVSTASIQADAITEAKIADDAVESEHLNNNIISGQTELASAPDSTDELLISDGGTLKRIDVSLIGGANTPSFAATRNSAQSLSHDAITKIQYDVELHDSDSKYDTSNYRFTPGTAGKYLIIHQAFINKGSDSAINTMSSYIYKNGSSYGYSQINFAANPVRAANLTHQAIITMDADDYVEPYAYINVSGGVDLESSTAAPLSIFMGFKIIGA